MKLTVYDFFDAFDEGNRGGMAQEPSPERIRELTMKKIENAKKKNRPVRKTAVMAAALAAVCLLSATAYAAWSWNGFLSTDGMSQREIEEMMEKVQYSGGSVSVDSDGTVHYFDSEGKEVMVLMDAQAQQFEQAMQEEREKWNREAAENLIDLSTLPMEPRSITPVTTDESGSFEDFLLGNGSMVILYEADTNGYELHAGDVVTVRAEASDVCIVEFSMFQDGGLIEAETVKSQRFEQTFTVPEDGIYCFSLKYCSADCDQFTNCSLEIR